ncbi:golgin subfamily A member 6-like protein 26 [Topomyia yanbarensis]|uniref:golgin subfamily A member 6-like protein 26 n=1 Tax=Topomyia yanbarensis TaxID=2498891 RepID=UPI00273C755F|nr:golgin subfamily A member 6-like protein 26 [Topomyia yanbarensis]
MIKELYQPVEPQSLQPCYVPASAAIAGSLNAGRKAMLLSATKWNKLLANADGARSHPQTTAAFDRKMNETEFKEYLKNESLAMTKQWENTVQNIREKKESERLRKQQEKIEEDEIHYRELKISDEIQRKELIQKAEEVIQKEKEGPRVLESAAKFCEVLKAREYQRKFKADREIQMNQRRKELDQQDIAQANRWIKTQAERYMEDRKRFDCYKKELKEKIENDRRDQKLDRTFMIDQERKQNEALEDEVKRQVEKEKKMYEKNKEMRRQHALEAMRMAQEREERLKRESGIEDTLNQIYNDGQKAIADKMKEIHVTKHKFRDNTQLLQDDIIRQNQLLAAEEKNREKAIQQKVAVADERERKKIESDKQQKAARIQAHLDEMNWQKARIAEQKVLERKEMADRLKNVDVTFGFDQRKVTNKTIKTHAHRKLLLDQIEERRTRENVESDTRAELQYMRNSAEKENRHFINYAEELITDSKGKGRPVLPLLRTVGNYKREHYLDHREKEFTPRHLVSNVPINNKSIDQKYIHDPAIIEMTPAMPPIRVRYEPEQLKNMNPYKNCKM